MPILWKYLLRDYFRFLFLCVSAFIAVLLVTRFEPIALFASSGAGLRYIGLFSLCQIPYILPIAIPVSCLIASMILFRKKSASFELTALRSGGISFGSMFFPLFLSSCLLSVLNFTVISEIAPLARTRAKHLMYEVAQENPLILLQKDAVLDIKTASFDLKKLQLGEKAEEVLCVIKRPSSERIGLFTAEEISVDGPYIRGKSISIISGAPSENGGFDHLFLEHQETVHTDKAMISEGLFQSEWFEKEDLLEFKNLIRKCSFSPQGTLYLTELIRRLCIGFSPLTFTWLGIAFGVVIGRRKKTGPILQVFALSVFIIVCFVASKTLHHKSLASAFCLFALPQILAASAGYRSLSLSTKGIE